MNLAIVLLFKLVCYRKMNRKVRLFFDRKKKATNKVAGAVEIVVCIRRERTYINSGISVLKFQWEDGLIINHPCEDALNEQLHVIVEKYEGILIAMEANGDEMLIRNFKARMTGQEIPEKNNGTFLPWMRERIEKRVMREGTRRGHLTTFFALQRFGKFKSFDDLKIQNIYAFDLFIREEKTSTRTGKPIFRSQAAIHNYHKRFRSYVTEAFRLGLIRENPYSRFVAKRGEKVKRSYLSKDQVQKLQEMRNTVSDAQTVRYIDFFLFQLFTGMAYSDAKLFDYSKHVINIDGHEYIRGSRLKTGGEFVVPILPYTRKILERNNFKLNIASNQKYNQFLKGIGVALGCNFPLTSHVARHTFACTIILGEGIPKEILQVMMGHASIKTTEIYAHLPVEFISRNVNEQLLNVWQ